MLQKRSLSIHAMKVAFEKNVNISDCFSRAMIFVRYISACLSGDFSKAAV
jgi:hypothetical protein